MGRSTLSRHILTHSINLSVFSISKAYTYSNNMYNYSYLAKSEMLSFLVLKLTVLETLSLFSQKCTETAQPSTLTLFYTRNRYKSVPGTN